MYTNSNGYDYQTFTFIKTTVENLQGLSMALSYTIADRTNKGYPSYAEVHEKKDLDKAIEVLESWIK